MLRFSIPPDDGTVDPRVQEIFESIRANLGLAYTPLIFRALSLNPAVLSSTWDHYRASVLQGRIPTSLKSLIGQAIAYMMGCPAATLNDSSKHIESYTIRGSLNARERQMLDFALQAATEPETLEDADFDALRGIGLWDDEIFELTATAGIYMNLVNFGLSVGLGIAAKTPGATRKVDSELQRLSRDELLAMAEQFTSNEPSVSARLSTVVETGLALMAAPSFSEIFQTLGDQAKWVVDFDQISLSLLEGENATYRLHTLIADCSDLTCEPTISPFIRFNATEGLPGSAMTTGRPILTSDLARHSQASPQIELPLTGIGMRSAMILPLRIGERTFGTLNFISRRSDAYQSDDLWIGQALALQLSAALDAARLLAQIDDERSTLSAIIQSTVDGLLMVNSSGTVILANPAIQAILNLSPAQIIGSSLDQAITQPALLHLFEQTVGDLNMQRHTAEITLSDRRIFEVSIDPVLTHFGETIGYMALLHDVTTLKSLSQLKSDFVSNVSHDLKTPITTLMLSAGMFDRVGPLNDMQKSLLTRVNNAADRMLSLVTDLLDLTKIEAGINLNLAPCDLSQAVSEVIESQRPLAEAKQQTIVMKVEPDLSSVLGDTERLKQVIANFVSNAIKYTPDNGQITVAASRALDQVQVTVSDTGYGIPAKDLPNIFDKFYRVEAEHTRKTEGTGLGLAITRSIIDQHGGHVWVESQPGQGSTFGFRLKAQPELVLMPLAS